MENKNEESVLSGADETQKTGSDNNARVDNKAIENPANDSNALTNNMQEEVNSTTTNQVNPISDELPIRNIPLTHHQSNDNAVEMAYSDALKLESIKEDAIFEIVDSSGRGRGSRFVADTNVSRTVKTYLPKNGSHAILPIGRNSDKASEGGLIGSTMVELGFSPFRFISTTHKLQVTLVLINGKNLVGYVLKGNGKGSRRAFYFPKNDAEKVIALPEKGKQLKLQVAKLLIG